MMRDFSLISLKNYFKIIFAHPFFILGMGGSRGVARGWQVRDEGGL